MTVSVTKTEIFTRGVLPGFQFLLSVMLLAGVLVSCIKPFVPDIKTSDLKKYVVSGMVMDGDGCDGDGVMTNIFYYFVD